MELNDEDEFNKALKDRVAARWDYEVERKKTLLDKEKIHRFPGRYRIPYEP